MPELPNSLPSACSTCKWRYTPIPGDGPTPARVLFFGEGPARDEWSQGRVFAGRSGREMDRNYLPTSGLCRGDGIFLSNICKCPQRDFGNPEPEQVEYCAKAWVGRELRYVQPEVIVTLGAIACEELFPDCNLELEHGLPRRAEIPESKYGEFWSGIHVAMYHPAAGMRREEFLIPLHEDFKSLPGILHGEVTLSQDQFPIPYYRSIETVTELTSVLDKWSVGREVAQDTEATKRSGLWDPWGLSFSFEAGSGYVIRNHRRKIVSEFAAWLQDCRPVTVFHNYLFDVAVLETMGVLIPDLRWTDTMQLTYGLGNVPQGLKALAYRLCGMRMQDFEDVVLPYSREKLLGFFRGFIAAIEPEVLEKKKCGCWKLFYSVESKLQKIEDATTRKKRPLRDLKKLEDRIDAVLLPSIVGGHYSWSLTDSGLVWELEPGREHSLLCESEPETLVPIPGTDKGVMATLRKVRGLVAKLESGSTKVRPWKLWDDEWNEGDRELISGFAASEFPRPSIEDVPEYKAVYYSGRDADATIRILPILRKMAAARRREVQG